jgi:KAP family P-loop domain
MWPDNETDVDLLGFDFLVDELLVLLKEPKLLPVTIGIAGDWGSGKSSVLKMAAQQLRAEKDNAFLVVEFSPWRFEDYADVKASLLAAVLGAVQTKVEAETDAGRKKKLLALAKRLVLRVRWLPMMRMVAAATLTGQADLTPEQIALLSSPFLTGDLEKKQEEALAKVEAEAKPEDRAATLADFRETFQELMDGLGVQALVVLVDDLDRCLPDTIIDVFEAIRLFLHVPKTAFVIAADHRIVQAAVEHAYPEAVKSDPSIGTDYLEKILQVTVSIPPLSAAESETYTNLLMAEANTSPEDFAKLVEAARSQRAKANLSVAMNHGIAEEALGALSAPLSAAFAIASRISPALAPKHKGNPRQIKRFLNLYQLRQGAAKRRDVALDPATLAKLMVLESLAPGPFHTLFGWQAAGAGKPAELAKAEAVAAGDTVEDLDVEISNWMALPFVKEWLKLDPALKDVNLGPYFFYSRDRFTPALPAARLSPGLQALLAELRSDTDGVRKEAVSKAVDLGAPDFGALYTQLLALALRAPGGKEMKSAIAIAMQADVAQTELKGTLLSIPLAEVSKAMPMQLKIAFGVGNPMVKDVFDRWGADEGLRASVDDARKETGKAK